MPTRGLNGERAAARDRKACVCRCANSTTSCVGVAGGGGGGGGGGVDAGSARWREDLRGMEEEGRAGDRR